MVESFRRSLNHYCFDESKLLGAPNDGFLLNTLKTLFSLSRVRFDF